MNPWRGAAAALLFVAAAAPATGFEGRVLLPDGEPAAGAIVQILGRPGSVVTDAGGRFVWLPEPAPPFHVLVVLPGDRYTNPVFVESLGDSPLEIRVQPLAVVESVTVTSGAVPHTDATPASAPAVISGEAIRTRQAPRLTDVLEAVPGGGRSSDFHASVPSLRGLSRGRTVLLLDGARVITERRAGASATFLDPFFLEAVEVVRGPSPVAYGSDAFGGVIHARTRRPDPGDPWTARGRGTLGAGVPETSFGAEVSGSALGAGLLVQGRRRVFSEYSSPEGVVPGSGAEDFGMLLRGLRELGGGVLGASVQYDAARRVGRPRRTSSFTSYPREDSLRFVSDYQLLPRWGFARLEATAFFGANRLETRREASDGTTESEVAAQDLMLRTRGVRPLGAGRLELGAEYLSRFGVHSETSGDPGAGSASSLAGSFRREGSVFGEFETNLSPQLSGSVGARLSAVVTRAGTAPGGDRPATTHAAPAGFVALRSELAPGLALTGQLSRGFRDPTLSDRYYNGLSGRGVVHGNPDLDPERSVQGDLSLRLDLGRVHGGIHAYRYRITDAIERYEDGPDLFFFRNRGEARLSGLELEFQIGTPADAFVFDFAAAAARGTAEDASALDGVVPGTLRAGLRRRLPRQGFAEVVFLGFAEDSDPGPTEAPTAAHARLDAALGFSLASGAELRVSGRNLLNAAYAISADAHAVLAPGRTLVATVVWTLGTPTP